MPDGHEGRSGTRRSGALYRHAAALAASLLAAGAIVATRSSVVQVDSATLAFLRYLLAAVCLAPFTWMIWRAEPLGRRDVWAVTLLGFGLFGLAPWLFNEALTLTSGAQGAVAYGAAPLFGMLAWQVARRQWPNTVQVAALAVGTIGLFIALAGAPAADVENPAQAGIGAVMMVLVAMITGVCIAVAKPILDRLPVLLIVGLALAAGAMVLVAPMAIQTATQGLPQFTNAGLLLLLFLGIPAGSVFIVIALWAADGLKPVHLSWYFVASLAAGLLFSAVLLGETMSVAVLIGGVLLATATFAAFWKPRPQRRERRGF